MKKIRLWKNRKELSDQYSLVDDEDYEKVLEAVRVYRKDGSLKKGSGKWYMQIPAGAKPYAMNGSRKSMHREIMKTPKGMHTDHINGDTLDNRKENLRVCTHRENCQNKKLRSDSASGMKGVYEIKKPPRSKYMSKKTGEVKYYYYMPKKRFQTYIGNPEKPNRNIKLGVYLTKEEAARAYDKKAIELFGEFAQLNFPNEHKNHIE
jgi:hypothetical protein